MNESVRGVLKYSILCLLVVLPHTNTYAKETVIFGGSDNTEKSNTVYLGAVKAVNGDITKNGLVVSGSATRSIYDYDTSAVAGNKVEADLTSFNALIGYQWVNHSAVVALYGGVDYQNHSLSPDDPYSLVKGKKTGGMMQLEILKFSTPVDASFILKASEVFNTYWARGRLGYPLKQVKAGIELTRSGNDSYDNERYGLYVNFPISRKFSLDIAAGNSNIQGKNSVQNSDSAYGSISFVTLF